MDCLTMKKVIVALGLVFCSTNIFAYAPGAENVIKYLDEPFTVTHLKELNVDCVWTRNENGYLENRNGGFEGTGVCWDIKATEQLDALEKAGKLVWHKPLAFDYEYGDKNKCYYRVDKASGIVDLLFGDVNEKESEECRKEENQKKALNLATKIKKEVRFGGYIATQDNILGSVILACYSGSIDSDSRLVSNDERTRRYKALLSLYEGDKKNTQRITNAFNFANNNLRDRYPLDTEGRYRARVCDEMLRKGKL